MIIRNNKYGLMSNAALDPKAFMIQALQKCILNNNVIIKMIDEKNEDMIKQRILNSTKLIEEMDLTLNKEESNPAVDMIVTCFNWVKEELKDVKDFWEKDPDTIKQRVIKMNPVLEDLLEGFRGMES